MAGGMDFGGTQRGGRRARPLDAPVNVVPFIDLMAVTISFLLLTAVWTQAGTLQVASTAGNAGAPQGERSRWRVLVQRDRVTLEAPLNESGAPWHGPAASLGPHLRTLAAGQPAPPFIDLYAEDEVAYEDVVRAVDACFGAGLTDVTVHAG